MRNRSILALTFVKTCSWDSKTFFLLVESVYESASNDVPCLHIVVEAFLGQAISLYSKRFPSFSLDGFITLRK
jgi:hypothetical protein